MMTSKTWRYGFVKSERILILGAGYAGIRVAKKLLKQNKENVDLVLIDQNSNHTLVTNLHEVASGRVSPEAVQIPLKQIFRNDSIELIQDRIIAMDMDNKRLTGEKENYSYDRLIVASGATANFYGISGARDHTLPIDSLADALRIREKIFDPSTREVIVCGAGLTGVELAADLKVMQPHLSVRLIEAQSSIMPGFDTAAQQRVEKKLNKIGVEVWLETRVEQVEEGEVYISNSKGSKVLSGDVLIWTSGTQAQWTETVAEPGSLVAMASRCATSQSDVYIAGDAGSPQYACVENGLQSADCLVENFERMEKGEEPKEFKFKDKGQMIALGPVDGVTTTRVPLRGWLAQVLKFLVDLYYVISVGGLGAGVNYFNGHLVKPNHGKTLTGNLLATRGQRLWLFPLRLYLGALWFTEALKKIIGPQNYEAASGLKDYFSIGSDSWLKPDNLMVPFPWLRDVDALSGATMGGTSGPIVEKLPFWYEALMRTIMPNPSLANFFQTLMVWTEFAVGVGLILGLLTWLASFVSFALILNFIISGVAGWQLIWILPASLALMAGAGHFIGVDAWLIPKIRTKLNIYEI